MTYRYDQTSIYGITNPEPILYGDGWFYGAVIPTQDVAIPKNVYVLHEKDYNIISWENSGTDDMTAYIVYRSKTYGHNDAEKIAEIDFKDDAGNTQTCYIDYLTESELNIQYYYSVEAVNNVGLRSFKSEWNADINQDVSFSQYAYMYTDGTTQTYWNTLDLYKQLGNFDTDRNVIPFRDLGVNYIQTKDEFGNVINSEIKKSCNYLYATLLDLDEDQKSDFSRLEYKLYMDSDITEIAKNKPNIITSAYIYETDSSDLLKNLSVNKNTLISYFMKSDSEDYALDYGDGSKTFNYISKIENPDENLRVLTIDRNIFFSKILEVNNMTLPSANNGNANVSFTFNGQMWYLQIAGNDNVIENISLEDYGISYGIYSVVSPGTKINIYEYWELENADEDESKYVNSFYDVANNIIELRDSDSKSYGIYYKFDILENNVSFTVEFGRRAFVYFRVPYVYNSKILQTYIKETGVTGKIFNKINFKTYNYLIFPNTIGKIFNQQNIKLKQMHGNLYKTDVENSMIYKNFGSYFDFIQPSWMGEQNYRDCVLGSGTIAGLLTAGMNGGTLTGLKQIVNSYSQGVANLTDQSFTKYLTVYNSMNYIGGQENLPTVLTYNPQESINPNTIICITDYVEDSTNNLTLNITNIIPDDADINIYGNGQQTENQITIEAGNNILTGDLTEASYILTDCELIGEHEINPNIGANYYMYITDTIDTDSTSPDYNSVEITISNAISGPDNPSLNDYWFNTNSTRNTSYKFKTMYKYNGTSWEEYSSDLLCNCDSINYYYISQTLNTVSQGLYQIIEIDNKYFICVNNFFKDVKYSIDNANDNRVSIVQLIGSNWVTVGYDVPEDTKEDWIFLSEYVNWVSNKQYRINDIVVFKNKVYKCLYDHVSSDFNSDLENNYWELLGFAALSYTHNYIVNTWNLEYAYWVKNVPFTKYVVYGNTIKVNDDYAIDNNNFVVKDYLTNNEFIRNTDYIVKNNTVIWQNYDTKPVDGSYVSISYDVDTRPETVRLINLIKYPQVHINYVWE